MNVAPPYITFSAKEAATRFTELLDEALGRPVGITKQDQLAAYVVSKRDFESMLANIEELKDQLLLVRAELARKEGFESPKRVNAFLKEFGDIDYEITRDNS